MEITLKKENKSLTRMVDLKNEKETIDEIYKMGSILENIIYAENVRVDDHLSYLRDRI